MLGLSETGADAQFRRQGMQLVSRAAKAWPIQAKKNHRRGLRAVVAGGYQLGRSLGHQPLLAPSVAGLSAARSLVLATAAALVLPGLGACQPTNWG